MMRLAIVSHKVCWKSADSSDKYLTDGGFPLQVEAISELFNETGLLVPCEELKNRNGLMPIEGINLRVIPLSVPKSKGFVRKLFFPLWLAKNGTAIWKAIRQADAVHTPIPGDVGTIGMLFAIMQKKPLFVRHCGNWLMQKTKTEQLWKWSMERFAGGRNVMFATGGTDQAPSERNPNIKWIFSTSLRNEEMPKENVRQFPHKKKLKLITVCRLENNKGVDIVISSLPLILKSLPDATLDIVGDGSLLKQLKKQTERLNLKDKVNFHGRVKHSKVLELMRQAHVFCYPSASEGFPKVVIEALASGLPVITTKVSVLPKLIGQGRCGVLLENETEEELAQAVVSVCTDAARYEQMSSNAIAKARQYSLESWRDFIEKNLKQAWEVSSLSSTQQ